jgi:hypothetical protein
VGNQKIFKFDIVTRLKKQLLEDPPLEKITKLAASQAAPGPHVQVRYSSFRKASPGICSGTFRKGGARIGRGGDHRASLLLGDPSLSIPSAPLFSHIYMYNIASMRI